MKCLKMRNNRQASRSGVALTLGLGLLLGSGPVAPAAEDLFVEGEITTFLARDLDGDGQSELLVSYHRDEQRFLAVFRGASRYPRAPERVLVVDSRAVLFAVGDYDTAPGLELVLISRSSGVIYPLRSSDGSDAYRRLFKTELFFNMPSVTHLPVWLSRTALDLDGDGREDFVLPEKTRLRLLTQRQDGEGGEVRWGGDVELPVSYYLLVDSRQQRIRASVESFADVSLRRANLLEAAAAFPYPVFADFDGDGRTDVIVKQIGNLLEVFQQRSPGVFGSQPAVKMKLPWAGDVSSLLLEDVNDDGRLDLLASRLLLKELATEIKVFVQDPQDPGLGFLRPRQLLRVSGFFQRPVLADVNGDGRADLLVAQ